MDESEQIKQIQKVKFSKDHLWFFQKISWLSIFVFAFFGFVYLSLGSGKMLNLLSSFRGGGGNTLVLGLGSLLGVLLLFNGAAGVHHHMNGRRKRSIHSFVSVLAPIALAGILFLVNTLLNPSWIGYLSWISAATNVFILALSIVTASFFYESIGKYSAAIPAAFLLTLGIFGGIHYLNVDSMADNLETYSDSGDYENNLKKTRNVLPPLDDTATLLVASDHAETVSAAAGPTVSEPVTSSKSVCGGTLDNIREYSSDNPKEGIFLLWRHSVQNIIQQNPDTNVDLERERYTSMTEFANYETSSEPVNVNSCSTNAEHYGVRVDSISCSNGLRIDAQKLGDRQVNNVIVTVDPVDGSEQSQRSVINQTWTKDLQAVTVNGMQFTQGKDYRVELTLNQELTMPIYCEGGDGFTKAPKNLRP